MAEKTRCDICNISFPNEDALAMHNSAKHINPENIKANKSFIYFIVIFLVVVGIIYFAANAGNSTGNVVNGVGNAIVEKSKK